jgi:hypothetical protein
MANFTREEGIFIEYDPIFQPHNIAKTPLVSAIRVSYANKGVK